MAYNAYNYFRGNNENNANINDENIIQENPENIPEVPNENNDQAIYMPFGNDDL